jgi:hypothetical protein
MSALRAVKDTRSIRRPVRIFAPRCTAAGGADVRVDQRSGWQISICCFHGPFLLQQYEGIFRLSKCFSANPSLMTA